VIIAGHAFIQNLRRGRYDIALGTPPATRLAAAFKELARARLSTPGGGFLALADDITQRRLTVDDPAERVHTGSPRL
jgi:hypothetical protein